MPGHHDLDLVRWVRASNIWVLRDHEGRRFVVDTGHRLERRVLARTLRRLGLGKGDLTAVLLTHRHSDHAGNAAWIREHLGCPVICHEQDAAVLEGRQDTVALARRPRRPPLVSRALCWIEDRFPARCPVDDVYGVGTWRWGFDIIDVSGHTEGSVLLYHAPTQTLFTGDAVLTGVPPFRSFERFGLAISAYSLDASACHERVARFVDALPPLRRLASGHGPLVTDDPAGKLRRLMASPVEGFAP